jgi:hypothetical protein
MFDQSLKGVDTTVVSQLALLPNKTEEEQHTASFEGVFLSH